MSDPTSGTAVTAPVKIGELEFHAPISGDYHEILSPGACGFVARLAERFEGRRQALLAARSVRQEEIRNGRLPDFLEETRGVRCENSRMRDRRTFGRNRSVRWPAQTARR